MNSSLITKDQLIDKVGMDSINKLNNASIDFTDRPRLDDLVEFDAGIKMRDLDGNSVIVKAFFYHKRKDVDAAGENWRTALSWTT